MRYFWHRPFLVIAPCVGLGALLEDSYHFGYSVVFLLLLATCLALILQRKLTRSEWVLSPLLLAFAALGALSMQLTRGERNPVKAESIVAVGKVTELADTDATWRKAVVQLSHQVTEAGVSGIGENLLVLFHAAGVKKGDILVMRLEAEPIRNRNNPGEFDASAYWNHHNIFRMAFVSEEDLMYADHPSPPLLADWLDGLRHSFSGALQTFVSEEMSPLAHALIMGDKSLLSAEDKASFSNAGAMHVLAVSGLHVGIVVYLLMFLFERMPRIFSKSGAYLLALLIIWIYAGITGFPPSVQRAAFMFSLLVLAKLIGRRSDSLNILFFSGFVLLLLEPLLIYDIGFQLSYLAMTGILTLYRPIEQLLFFRQPLIRKVWQGTAVGIAAQTTTLPLTLYYFHQFPNYFAISNLLVMLMAAFILGAGLLLFVVQGFSWIAVAIGTGLSLGLAVLLWGIQWVEALPGAVARGFEMHPYVVVLAYILLFAWMIVRPKGRRKRFWWGAAVLLLIGVQTLRMENWKRTELVVFNSLQPVVALKQGGEIWCFYPDHPRAGKMAHMLMADYAKVYPGKVHWMRCHDGVGTEMEELGFNCSFGHRGVLISWDTGTYFIRRSHKAAVPAGATVLDMPYMPVQESSVHLGNGAWTTQLR